MTRAAVSVLVFAFYLLALGALLVVAPNVILGLFGLPAASEVWIRVVGVLTFNIGYYYAQAARHGLTQFFRFTVHARSAVVVFFAAFVAAGLVKPVLILFGLVDLAGAVWTWRAIPRSSAQPPADAARR
jgi:hypothetical protein